VSIAIRHALIVSAVAFALNLAWENAQCTLFFVHTRGDATEWDMFVATVGDVVLTWIAYAAVATVSRRWLWGLEPWRGAEWAGMTAAGLVLSVAVELYALGTNRWAYTPINPTIPGTPISLLPVAQLVLLFPVTFALARAAAGRDGTRGAAAR
jgi:hypothetical protein